MIKSIYMKNFRKHEDLRIDFTSGINAVRGPNEVGKSTVQEAILYALYGSKVLRTPLSECVTSGKKESDLKAELVMEIKGVLHVFTRGKSGAECNYEGGKATGQAEVSAFAAQLLGADAKTASVLMLADQAGLRGALDDGPAAVSGLMGKLADFDLVDRIIEGMQHKLLLGSEQPIREKLAEAEKAALEAEASLPFEIDIIGTKEQIKDSKQGLETLNSLRSSEALPSYERAKAAFDDGKQIMESRKQAELAVTRSEAKVQQAGADLEAAQAKASVHVSSECMDALRQQITNTENHAVQVKKYQEYQSLGQYPSLFWEGTASSFRDECDKEERALRDAERHVMTLRNDLKLLEKELIQGGTCPTCGTDISTRPDVIEKNERTQGRIAAKAREINGAEERVKQQMPTIAALKHVKAIAKPYEQIAPRLHGYCDIDDNFYPPKVTWKGDSPAVEAQDVNSLKQELAALEKQQREVAQAEGMVKAYDRALTEATVTLQEAKEALAAIPAVDPAPFEEQYNQASKTLFDLDTRIYNLQDSIKKLENDRIAAERKRHEALTRLENARKRVDEYRADIEKLAFNNALLKKMRTLKPAITDHLWSSVLAAVSNFFSTLRGENSVVTKDAGGFKVNGKSIDSLSGSTLDILALAVRIALTKTFIPHVDFLILDEPAHGADVDRTSSILGFLSSVGLNQVILASHDEMSESVADNVIVLGA